MDHTRPQDPHGTERAGPALPVEVEVVRGAMGRIAMLGATLRGATTGESESIARSFAENLGGALQAEVGPVIIEVERNSFSYAGAELGGGDLVMGRLLESLDSQGLRAITLLPWVTQEELVELAALLSRDWLENPGQGLESAANQRDLWRVHLEIGVRGLVTEADGEVRTVDLVRRLLDQLGLDEAALEGGVAVEVGAMMAMLRRTEEQGPPESRARGGSTGSVATIRQLRQLEVDRDVSENDASIIVYEAARSASTDEEATELVRLALRHVQNHLATGDVEAAALLLRRWLLLVDPDSGLPIERRIAVQAALRDMVGEATRDAVDRGWAANPDDRLWRGPVFTLARCASLEDLPRIVAIGRTLPAGILHQSISDALILVAQRDEVSVRGLLLHADQEQLPFVLRMVRRSTDATLVEPALARITNEDPAVREAVLISLRNQRSRRIGEVARGCVNDTARPVRMEALRYISVYRDAEAVPLLLTRLQAATERDANFEELRAVAIAAVLASRGEAIVDLEAQATGKAGRHPRAAEAALAGIKAAGPAGKEALDRIARTHEALRPLVRAVIGGGR